MTATLAEPEAPAAHSPSPAFSTQAEATARARLADNPYDPQALAELATALLDQGQHEQAAKYLRQALIEAPERAELHFMLGLALEPIGRIRESAAAFEQTIARNPGHADAWNNLGAMHIRLREYEQATNAFVRAAQLQPGNSHYYSNLGSALREQGKLEEARPILEKTVELDPNNACAWTNLGDVLSACNQPQEGSRCYQRALELNPDEPAAAYNQSIERLAGGDLANGWSAYETRKRLTPLAHARYPYPHLLPPDGPQPNGLQANGQAPSNADSPDPPAGPGDISDKTILVYAEQGVGDEILFVNCIPDLIRDAGQVIIDCDPRLAALFARSFPEATIHPVDRARNKTGPKPKLPAGQEVDYQIAAGSLPGIYRKSLADFPGQGQHQGYLKPDPERVAHWRARLAELGEGRKIGFAWRSGLRSARRDVGYTDIDDWGPILSLPGNKFINLQYGECADELAHAQDSFGVDIVNFGGQELDLKDDLDDCAALYQALDLIIGPNTAVTSLAGATGANVWMLGGGWIRHAQPNPPWYPGLVAINEPLQAACTQPSAQRSLLLAIKLAELDAPKPPVPAPQTPEPPTIHYWGKLAKLFSQTAHHCEGIGHAIAHYKPQWLCSRAFLQAMTKADQHAKTGEGLILLALLHGYLDDLTQAEKLIEQAYAIDETVQDGFARLAWLQFHKVSAV
ncbi:tetratricopeptide repeat protein [Thiorhodovibrio frisius]|uniref:Flp pilus assembly protein TadD n=1 Tax=Thiorhodovibrio frisius TaxID=631362 RepID=H8Z089_9GAMM|nr:tetratricopeptide repeat protein [Thiorhodovibrio frisius]EIC22297.1 Flp pilus assembly protein TadD [Thiorhodovibrio frisius]WPL24591.1 TPR repeat-containing protein YrrB [Thiorhodovibrio frisius]